MKIELAGISKVYGRCRALHEIREEFEPGRIVAILGLNGAGKSTLLHCLAGLLKLSEGEIYLDDELFRRDRIDLRRRIGFLPDYPIVFHEMTGLQHIGMGLRLYDKDEPGVEERVIEVLRALGVLSLAEAPLGILSRGQLYKMALTGLIATNPEVWLLDEPMASGMDAVGLREFRARARAAAEAGATILYTTQIVSVAQQFSDEAIILHKGRVQGRGPVAELHASGEHEELLAGLREET